MVPEMHKPRAFSHYFVDISQSALLLPEASAVLLCDDFMSLMVSNLMVNSLAPNMTSVCVCVETSFVIINMKDGR